MTQQYQAVTGAVDTCSTPYVGYNYSDPSNGSLLTGMVYPNGRTINYNYGDTGGVLMGNSNAMLDNVPGLSQAEAGPNWAVKGSPSLTGNWTIVSESQAIQNASAVQTWTETFERTYAAAVEGANSHCDPTTGQQVYHTGTEIVEQRVTVTSSRQNNANRNASLGAAIGVAGVVIGLFFGPAGIIVGAAVGWGGGLAVEYFSPYGAISAAAGAPELVPTPAVVTGETPEPP